MMRITKRCFCVCQSILLKFVSSKNLYIDELENLFHCNRQLLYNFTRLFFALCNELKVDLFDLNLIKKNVIPLFLIIFISSSVIYSFIFLMIIISVYSIFSTKHLQYNAQILLMPRGEFIKSSRCKLDLRMSRVFIH